MSTAVTQPLPAPAPAPAAPGQRHRAARVAFARRGLNFTFRLSATAPCHRLPSLPSFPEVRWGFPLVNYLLVAGNALTAPSEGVRREHVNGVGVAQSDGLQVVTEHAHHPGSRS